MQWHDQQLEVFTIGGVSLNTNKTPRHNYSLRNPKVGGLTYLLSHKITRGEVYSKIKCMGVYQKLFD